MKRIINTFFVVVIVASVSAFSFKREQGENVEFVCMRKHMASKTCHYNFKVDGAKYRYVDIGCKNKKQDDVIEKAKAGDIALAREWKIECLTAEAKKPN